MAGEIQLNSTTMATESSGSITLSNVDSAANRQNLGLEIGVDVQQYDADTTKNDVANTFTANQIISVTDNTNAALRVTQLGTGNALVVEDSANPDSTPFVVDASGNVGIGATSLRQRLTFGSLTNTATATPDCIDLGGTYSNSAGSNLKLKLYEDGTVTHGFGVSTASTDYVTSATGSHTFFQSTNERMRIDSNGSSRFFANNPIIAATSASANSTTSNAIFIGRHSATSTTNGTNCIFITSNGNIYNANLIYGQISDEKLKENIIDATNKLPDVLNLRVRNFNFKQGQTHKQIGFIAQEFEQVFPHLVDNLPDVDADGNETGEFTKTIKTSVLMPILVKAIQEQQAIIETQQSQIDALTARIEALETT